MKNKKIDDELLFLISYHCHMAIFLGIDIDKYLDEIKIDDIKSRKFIKCIYNIIMDDQHENI